MSWILDIHLTRNVLIQSDSAAWEALFLIACNEPITTFLCIVSFMFPYVFCGTFTKNKEQLTWAPGVHDIKTLVLTDIYYYNIIYTCNDNVDLSLLDETEYYLETYITKYKIKIHTSYIYLFTQLDLYFKNTILCLKHRGYTCKVKQQMHEYTG